MPEMDGEVGMDPAVQRMDSEVIASSVGVDDGEGERMQEG